MKIFKTSIIFFLLFFVYTNQNIFAIVRHTNVPDKKYIELSDNFNNIVRIETDSSYGSGVILNNHTIITSAHNLKFKKNIKIIDEYIEIEPINIIYHKNKDIALIKVNQNLNVNKNTNIYNGDYKNKIFTIIGYGFTGTGDIGATTRDFKKRAGHVRCLEQKNDFYECLFSADDDLEAPACAAQGDSGGGVFSGECLAGIITYVTGKGGDGIADSSYGDRTAFIPINSIEEWILENL